MKIIPFLSKQIASHKAKSIGFLSVIILIILLGYGVIWIYQNISSAVSYYSNLGVSNPQRVKISNGGNIFDFLATGVSGISNETLEKIENDDRLKNLQRYTLLQYPVLGDFSVFSFNLESDIPVFAVSGETNLGEKGVGISRKMLEYYNLQFAGSSPVFPKIDDFFIKGKKVVITVGKSKIFDLEDQKSATPIGTEIVNISPDYPGFGIVLPEKILQERLDEVGLSLGNPYKIVAEVKNLDDIESLRDDYGHLTLHFDRDTIQENMKRLGMIQLIFGGVFLCVILVVGTIILFLLGSILREIRHIYRLIYRLGIINFRSVILTLGEPIFLSFVAGIIGYFLCRFIFGFLFDLAINTLPERGINFSMVEPKSLEIFLYTSACVFGIIIILFYYNYRQIQSLKISK